MSVDAERIQPGKVFRGRDGHSREVVALVDGRVCYKFPPGDGEFWLSLRYFCRLATEEVPQEALHA